MSYRALPVVLCLAAVGMAAEPLRIHPDNPKYFLFRGKPLVLVTATEHYGSVINRPFDFGLVRKICGSMTFPIECQMGTGIRDKPLFFNTFQAFVTCYEACLWACRDWLGVLRAGGTSAPFSMGTKTTSFFPSQFACFSTCS
jgi:hypothetical protein